MGINIDKLKRLKYITAEKLELTTQEFNLSEPLLKDLSLMQQIYSVSVETLGIREPTAAQRKVFIFVMLYLYAPSVLIGARMGKGMRRSIAKALQLHSDNSVSIVADNVLFLYQNYHDFKDDADRVYSAVAERLGIL